MLHDLLAVAVVVVVAVEPGHYVRVVTLFQKHFCFLVSTDVLFLKSVLIFYYFITFGHKYEIVLILAKGIVPHEGRISKGSSGHLYDDWFLSPNVFK